MKRTAAFAAAALAAQGALAEDNWKGSAEMGLLVTTGNTHTHSFSAKADAVNDRTAWRYVLHGEALNSSQNGVRTAEQYYLVAKADRKLSDVSYVFGRASYENNAFNGYDYRVSETVGYGRTVVKRPASSLNLEGGLGARESKLTATGESRTEPVARFGADLQWTISATAKFAEQLNTDVGSKATVTKSVTSLSTQIVGNLASKLSYTATYTNPAPQPGVVKLDTETAVTLVYGF